MSNWQKVKLGEIAQIIDGDRGKNYPKNNEFFDKGFCLFLNTGNVTQDGFSFESNQFITEEKDSSLRKGKLTRGDLVYTTRGTVGNIAFYDRNVQFHNVRINSGMVILRANEQYVIASFLYQLLKSDATRRYIKSFCTGSAQPQLPIKNLSQILLDFPPKDVQHRIATILSRYDSLIENYQKQIKLLEEAAQRLYKEWFVDLRFPGHENTKIVDGVPEGWKKGVLNDIAYESGKKVDKKNRDYYNYYLPIDCLPKHSLTYLTPADISLAESSLVSFEENDIIFGAMRPYFHKVCFAQSNGLTRTTCFVLNSKENEYREYLLMLLFEDSTVKHATSISIGTTMPYTRWKEFKSMEIIIPAKEIAVVFGKQISRITNVLNKLSSQIRLLTEARDRLLPKLMSGEIAV